MENNRRTNIFWAFLLAAVLSLGGVGCVASGFSLPGINMGQLLLLSACSSLIWAIACRYRFGVVVVAAAGELFWLLPNARAMIESEKVLLFKISSALSLGYDWPVLYWDEITPGVTAQAALGLIVCIVSLIVAWTVVRQKKATVAAIAAFFPMMVCLILTDTVPDNEYLMMMLGGLVLLAMTNPLRRINARQASRATAMLLVPVMLATMGLFQVVPREDYKPNQSAFDQLEQWLKESPLWQALTGKGPSWSMGDSGADEVSLDTLGGKSESDKVAFSVTATTDGYLYLRGRSYDTYDGKHWTVSEQSSGIDNGWGSVYSNAARVTIRMDHAREFYYFPGENGPTAKSRYFKYGMLPNDEGEKEYTFYWGTPMPRTNTISSEMWDQCLQLPEDTKIWAMEALQQMGLQNTWRSAERIAAEVRQSAEYSLNPSRMPYGEDDFAAWFFDKAESGYCIHFATTATVLLRAAGIPARYVTGYAIEVPAGMEIAVPQSRAHAWVEYYTEGNGWKILDPTPGYNDAIEPPTLPPTEPITHPTEPSTQPTTRPTQPTEPTTQPTTPSELQPTLPSRPTPGKQEENKTAEKITAVLLWLFGSCAAIWAQYRLRIRIREWYRCRGGENEQALARWRSARIRSRIFRQKPPARLYQLAQKAKYSQHTLTEKELKKFDLHMAVLAGRLQKKPWLIRWLLRLIFAIE